MKCEMSGPSRASRQVVTVVMRPNCYPQYLIVGSEGFTHNTLAQNAGPQQSFSDIVDTIQPEVFARVWPSV
jgi:hypothetical protein